LAPEAELLEGGNIEVKEVSDHPNKGS